MVTNITNNPSVPAAPVGGNIASVGINAGWERVVEAYLAQKDCLEASRLTYRKGLRQYFNWLQKTGRRLDSLTKRDIVEWKKDLSLSGHSVKTVKLYIASVKGFYGWTSTTETADGRVIYPNIAMDVKAARGSQDSDTFVKMHLTAEQGRTFLDYFKDKAESGKETDIRNFAMMNLMIRTGLRSVEVCRADIGDVTTRSGRRILKVHGKGKLGKVDFVVLTDAAFKPISDYLDLRAGDADDEPLFANAFRGERRMAPRTVQFIGKEGMRAIGLDDHGYSLHSLRHTAGVQILMNGGSQFDVQDVLRHSSPVTSQIYLESIKEDRRLKEAPEAILDKVF